MGREGSFKQDFKNEQECFIGCKTTRSSQPFRPDKTRVTSFVNGLKNIPEKAFVSTVHKNYAIENVGN